MLAVPAIDILDGKVVRVKQGREDTATVYDEDPAERAKKFREAGARLIHVVDLDAAIHDDKKKNSKKLEQLLSVSKDLDLSIEVAGGIRSRERARSLLTEGASRIVLSSLAYSDLDSALLILKDGGADRVVLALDYDAERKVRTSGWKTKQKESVVAAVSRFFRLGFRNFLLTSIKHDGMLSGPDLKTLFELRKLFPKGEAGSARLIASGGISSIEDLLKLEHMGIDEAIIGKAIYERRISIGTLQRFSSSEK